MCFEIGAGEMFGLVGESGSGKSTVAKLITKLEPVTEGQILLAGEDITHLKGKDLIRVYKNVQMVFQDPRASFNPRLKIKTSLRETHSNLNASKNKLDISELLSMVDLKETHANRYPHELSGGECQRLAIARAIISEPKLLICDEATSALDVSIQSQIMDLLLHLNKRHQIAMLFISHDLAVVSNSCDKTGVMYRGDIVEMGHTRDLIDRPQAAYTKKLRASVLTVEGIA